jgi:hypothetical protein
MDREYVIQHDIVDRYLKGQLSAEDVAAFEAHCLWCRESLDELELAERMHEGFKDVDRTPNERAWSTRLRSVLSSPRYGAAASVLLAASLLTSGLLYRQLEGTGAESFASAQVYTLEAHRGSGGVSQRIAVGGPQTPVVLVVYPEDVRADHYRVSLFQLGNEAPRWQGEVAKPAAEALAVTLPGSLLSPGAYRLRVEDAAAAPGTSVVADVTFATFVAGEVR